MCQMCKAVDRREDISFSTNGAKGIRQPQAKEKKNLSKTLHLIQELAQKDHKHKRKNFKYKTFKQRHGGNLQNQ